MPIVDIVPPAAATVACTDAASRLADLLLSRLEVFSSAVLWPVLNTFVTAMSFPGTYPALL